jgi:hypothetical protein
MERYYTLTVTPARPKVEIGKRWTGRREVFYDTRTGEYHETLPVMDIYAYVLQQALLTPIVATARRAEEIRQKA